MSGGFGIQVYQDLARAWFGHVEHLNLGRDRPRAVVDACFVLLGKLSHVESVYPNLQHSVALGRVRDA
jgi:hypothetical protein